MMEQIHNYLTIPSFEGGISYQDSAKSPDDLNREGWKQIMDIFMHKTIFCAALAAVGLVSAPAMAADDDNSRFSVGVTGGTLGIGPEVSYRLSEGFGLRANATFLSISHGIDSDGINYDGKLKLGSGGVMLDAYPFGGGFRVSGGLRINGNKARAVATPTTNVDVGGTNYTPAHVGTLSARAVVKDVAPALTLGYGGGLSGGLAFGVEAGALFQGKVKIRDVKSSTGLIAQADLDREAASIQDDIDNYKIYPIVQLTLGYRF